MYSEHGPKLVLYFIQQCPLTCLPSQSYAGLPVRAGAASASAPAAGSAAAGSVAGTCSPDPEADPGAPPRACAGQTPARSTTENALDHGFFLIIH